MTAAPLTETAGSLATRLEKGAAPVTLLLVGVNALAYLAVAAIAQGLFPSSALLLALGGSHGPSVASGEWWRVLTAMFLHGGPLHLLFNLACLYAVGSRLERLLGSVVFLAVYLATGAIGTLVSLLVHPDVVSVGASGAIFGLIGVSLALAFLLGRGSIRDRLGHVLASGSDEGPGLTSDVTGMGLRSAPPVETTEAPPESPSSIDHLIKPIGANVGLFLVYNLLFGLRAGIDLAAHAGGALAGVLITVIALRDAATASPPVWRAAIPVVLAVALAVPGLRLLSADGGWTGDALDWARLHVRSTALLERLDREVADGRTTADAAATQLEKEAVASFSALLARGVRRLDAGRAAEAEALRPDQYGRASNWRALPDLQRERARGDLWVGFLKISVETWEERAAGVRAGDRSKVAAAAEREATLQRLISTTLDGAPQ